MGQDDLEGSFSSYLGTRSHGLSAAGVAECTLCLEASPDSQISLTPSPQGPSISYGTPYMCIRIASLILTSCWVNSSARDGRKPAGVEQ